MPARCDAAFQNEQLRREFVLAGGLIGPPGTERKPRRPISFRHKSPLNERGTRQFLARKNENLELIKGERGAKGDGGKANQPAGRGRPGEGGVPAWQRVTGARISRAIVPLKGVTTILGSIRLEIPKK